MLIRKIECEESNHRGHRESHDRIVVVVSECSVNGTLGSNTDKHPISGTGPFSHV
jgi:hypothetical protein